jgi:hypothetical protein
MGDGVVNGGLLGADDAVFNGEGLGGRWVPRGTDLTGLRSDSMEHMAVRVEEFVGS